MKITLSHTRPVIAVTLREGMGKATLQGRLVFDGVPLNKLVYVMVDSRPTVIRVGSRNGVELFLLAMNAQREKFIKCYTVTGDKLMRRADDKNEAHIKQLEALIVGKKPMAVIQSNQ